MKALHDINLPDPWSDFYNPNAPRNHFATDPAMERGLRGQRLFDQTREYLRDMNLPRYYQAWYDRYTRERAAARRDRDFYAGQPPEVFYTEPVRLTAWDPAFETQADMTIERRSSRDVIARLDADVARLEQLHLPNQYALTATRAELRALTIAGYLYEGALPEYRGYRIAVTG